MAVLRDQTAYTARTQPCAQPVDQPAEFGRIFSAGDADSPERGQQKWEPVLRPTAFYHQLRAIRG
jgi:hypothetical protein